MACRITNIKDENLKLLVQQYGQAEGLKRFIKGEVIAEAALFKVNENLDLYKKYNLLNKDNIPKSLNPSDPKIKSWLETLNQSPFYTFKFKKTPTGDKVFIYDKQSLFDYGTELFSQATQAPKSNQVVFNKLENLVRSLYDLQKKSKTRAERLEITNRIKKIEEQINKLKEEDTIENIQSTFEYQYRWMNNLLKKPNISQDNIATVNSMLSIWKDIKVYFIALSDIDNPDLAKVSLFDDIEKKAKDLDYKYTEVLRNSIIEQNKVISSNPDKFKKSFQKGLSEVIPDVDKISAISLSAGDVGNSLASLTDKVIKTSFRRTKDRYSSFEKHAKQIVNNLSDSDKKDFSWMYTTYKTLSGKEGMDFVDITSDEFYTERRKYIEAVNNAKVKLELAPEEKKKEYQKEYNSKIEELNKWRKENEVVIDLRYLDLFEYDISESEKTKYLNSLYEQLGSETALERIERAKSKYQDYLLDKEAYIIDQERIYLENLEEANTEELKERALQLKEENIKNWDLEHNPVYRLQHLAGENKTEASISGKSTKSYTYITTAPNSKNISEKYKAIQADPARREFYNFMKAHTKEMLSLIPDYYKKDFPTENFIPVVRKENVERFAKFNLGTFISKEYEDIISDITTNERDTTYVIRDADGKPLNTIPINYLNNNIALEDRSTDLVKIIQLFTATALNYSAASEIESFVNNTIEVAKRAKISEDINEAPKMLVSLLEYTRDANLYNKKYAGESEDWLNNLYSGKLYTTPEVANKAKTIENEIIKLKEESLNEKDPKRKEAIDKQVKELMKDLNSLPGGKLLVSKITDRLIDIQSKKAFVLNPFSASANLFFGLISNMTYSSGSRFMNDKDMVKAFGIMIESTKKFISGNTLKTDTTEKVLNLMDYFQIETKTGDLYGIDNGATKGFWSRMIDKGFFLMKSSDYFMRGQLMVAYTLNPNNNIKYTENSQEKTIGLWEIFNKNGEIKEQYSFLNDPSNENYESIKTQLENHRNTILAIQTEAHGNFDPLSTPMAKSQSLGRLASQFRLSWVSQGIKSRFQGEKYNEYLGTTKGRYITLFEQGGLKGILKTFAVDQFKYLFNKNLYDQLSETDQLNMKRNLRELYILQSLALLGLLLKYGIDDDDKKSRGYRVAINLINRSQEDIQFYLSPQAFNNIVKNPFPAFSVVIDGGKALDNSFKYLTDEDYTTKNFMLSLSRPLPVTSAINKVVTWSEKEF